MLETFLTVRDVSKSFNNIAAVDSVTFTLARGEALALIGPNGAGKSTLFNLVCGDLSIDHGRIEFCGVDISDWPANARARLGLSRSFQVASFFPSLTVMENLLVAFLAKRSSGSIFESTRSVARRASSQLERTIVDLGLARLLHEVTGRLAQGERKTVELAMLLMQDSKVLLLDEPTAGMSNEDVARMISMLQGVREKNPELSFILTAHDMDVVLSLSERVILMSQGRILLDDDAQIVSGSAVAREIYLGTDNSHHD